jgi:hypothetical protein
MKYLLSIFLLLLFVSCDSKKEVRGHDHSQMKTEKKNKVYYTCSMHPHVKEYEAGKCPICHMNLTKVEIEVGEDDPAAKENKKVLEKIVWVCQKYPDVVSEEKGLCPIDGSPMIEKKINISKGAMNMVSDVVAKVRLRKAQLSHFKPDYFPVTTMKMTKKIRLLGTVLQSEEREANIPARVPGRIEKVYVKSTGALISKGSPVVDLYSPQLITGGEEYILARKAFESSASVEYKELLAQSQEKLRLWGVKKKQMEKWYRRGKVPRAITIYSPTSGIVRKRRAVKGRYFKEGQSFFDLADLSDVWVELDVYEHDSGLVKTDQEVLLTFSAHPGKQWKGRLDFIDPVLNPKTRTLKVRATIENFEGNLKPGMVADGVVTVKMQGTPLVIPRNAVIDTGKRKVAWVKVSGKSFQAKVIKTGFESEGYVEVVEGLMESEEVVIEGNFLLDAQAQLFGGYESD